jgi:hypothetical protein
VSAAPGHGTWDTTPQGEGGVLALPRAGRLVADVGPHLLPPVCSYQAHPDMPTSAATRPGISPGASTGVRTAPRPRGHVHPPAKPPTTHPASTEGRTHPTRTSAGRRAETAGTAQPAAQDGSASAGSDRRPRRVTQRLRHATWYSVAATSDGERRTRGVGQRTATAGYSAATDAVADQALRHQHRRGLRRHLRRGLRHEPRPLAGSRRRAREGTITRPPAPPDQHQHAHRQRHEDADVGPAASAGHQHTPAAVAPAAARSSAAPHQRAATEKKARPCHPTAARCTASRGRGAPKLEAPRELTPRRSVMCPPLISADAKEPEMCQAAPARTQTSRLR